MDVSRVAVEAALSASMMDIDTTTTDIAASASSKFVAGKLLRRVEKKSYADLSTAQESRKIEREADFVQVKEHAENIDGDEEEKDGEEKKCEEEEEAYEEEVEPQEEDEAEEEVEEESQKRRNPSRHAKAITNERIAIHHAGRPPVQPKASLIDEILNSIITLDLNRSPLGFSINKVRSYIKKNSTFTYHVNRFNKAWREIVDDQLLYNVGNDANRWKMDRPRVADRNKRLTKDHKKNAAKKPDFPESGDEDEDVMIVDKPPTNLIDPAQSLLNHLRDALSPWKSQIEYAEAHAANENVFPNNAASSSHSRSAAAASSSSSLLGERRSRRQSSLLPDEIAANADHSYEETKDSSSAEPAKPTATRRASSRHNKTGDERKEKIDQDEDVIMTDVAPAAAPSSNNASSSSLVEMKSPEIDTHAVVSFLESRGSGLLSDFALFSVLRQPSGKLHFTQIKEALKQLKHLPDDFLHWSLDESRGSTSAAASASHMMDTGDVEEEHMSQTPIRSPLEMALESLVQRGMLSSSSRREYRATPAANEMAKSAAPTVEIRATKKSGKGSRGNSAQSLHTAQLRSIKMQLSFKQTAFIKQHLDVFAPFITNTKLRAQYHLPATIAPRTADDPIPTTKVEYPLYPIPKSIQSPELVREYQVKGFSFLAHLHDNGASAILADEMGLGKTLQTICFLAWLKENRDITGPHLVIVPLNVLDTWISEFHRWCPSVRAYRYHGSEKERKRIYDTYLQFGKFDVIITTYETAVVGENFFKYRFYFAYCIVDEAHRIKNELSLLSISLRHVNALNRVLLTGTPLQNSLHEAWALLNFLYGPGHGNLFPASEPFDKGFDLNHNMVNPNTLLAVQALLQPIMLRRLKKVVAPNLPLKTETQIKCRMAPYQHHWYKMLLASNSGLLDKLAIEANSSANQELIRDAADGDLSVGDAQVLHEAAKLDADGNIIQQQRDHIQHSDAVSAPSSSSKQSTSFGIGSGRRSQEKQEEEKNFGLGDNAEISASAGGEWRKLLNLMIQLRKVCNHPYIMPSAEPDNSPRDSIIETSGKLIMLEKLLAKLFLGKHRVLIFSGFLGMLDILERFCLLKKYRFLRLDGSTSRVLRKFDIARFNNSNEFFIYLLSTRAGGLGINLQTADTVIHYDSDWNPSVDLQAQDRAHRIGQTRPVRVFRLIMESTVEERIVARAQRKLYLDAMVTSGQTGVQSETFEKLDKKELLSMLKFGSDQVFQSSGQIEDRDIDAILAGSTTKVMNDDTIEKDAPQIVAAKLDCASFDSMKITEMAQNEFEGTTFKSTGYRSIVDSWTNLDSKKRDRASTTVMIGKDAVLRTNNYSWDSDIGRAKESRDIKQYNVEYKKFVDHEQYCLVCHDGGEVLICSACPRVFHSECLEFSVDSYQSTQGFRCPQHNCLECLRGPSDCGGMLFLCTSCPAAWCEDHAPKNLLPLRNDPALTLLGYSDKSTAFFVVHGEACMKYYEEHLKPMIAVHQHNVETENAESEQKSLNDLITSDTSDSTSTAAAATLSSSSASPTYGSPRKSSRALAPHVLANIPAPKSSTAAAASSSSLTVAAAASSSSASAASVNSAYFNLSDRLRGRIKKLMHREEEAAEEGRTLTALGEITEIAEVFLFMCDKSTMLHALHFILYGEEANVRTEAKSRVMQWTGISPRSTKFEAGDFYQRCIDEFSMWKPKSIELLSKMLHLSTQSPPKLITSGPLAGRMSHTEPRSFSINKGGMNKETQIRGDPLECVIEHMICFLMAPRRHAMALRFEYMQKSVMKDLKWAEELRIEKETGISRPKPKPKSKPKLEKKNSIEPSPSSTPVKSKSAPSVSPLKSKSSSSKDASAARPALMKAKTIRVCSHCQAPGHTPKTCKILDAQLAKEEEESLQKAVNTSLARVELVKSNPPTAALSSTSSAVNKESDAKVEVKQEKKKRSRSTSPDTDEDEDTKMTKKEKVKSESSSGVKSEPKKMKLESKLWM